jgi:ATP-binding cassette subfamily C protein CydC
VLLLPVLGWWIGRYNPWLAAVVIVLFLLAGLVLPLLAARASWRAGGRIARAVAALRTACLDTVTGLREVRAFGAEGRMLATVQGRESTLLAAQHDVATRAAFAGAAAFLAGQAALLAVLVALLFAPSVGLAASAFLVVAAFEAVAVLPRVGVAAGHAARAAERVLELADVPPAPVAAPTPMPPGSAIRIEAVHFAWAPDRPKVFDGLTLDIPQGSRVALLGPSGAGKSTLAALLLKVAAPAQGRILLGGTDIATLDDTAVRARIAWLSQATHLFSDTIRANLLLGAPPGTAVDDAQLWAALEAARIADLVRALPDGLDTWVGEGGLGFSGGQGRRLALARTLLSDAPILVLDEPCAGLDAATERAFFQALNDAAPGRTVLLIAHRLVGVERLDRIWRLSAGRAVSAAG